MKPRAVLLTVSTSLQRHRIECFWFMFSYMLVLQILFRQNSKRIQVVLKKVWIHDDYTICLPGPKKKSSSFGQDLFHCLFPCINRCSFLCQRQESPKRINSWVPFWRVPKMCWRLLEHYTIYRSRACGQIAERSAGVLGSKVRGIQRIDRPRAAMDFVWTDLPICNLGLDYSNQSCSWKLHHCRLF